MQSTDQELLNFGRDSEDEMDSEGEEEEEEEREAAGAGEPAQLALFGLPACSRFITCFAAAALHAASSLSQ